MAEISDDLRRSALHLPSSDADPPPGTTVHQVPGGVLVVTQSVSIVDVPDLSPGRAAQAVDAVRERLRDAGRDWAYWSIPADEVALLRALRACGLVENSRPPWEARFTALVLVHAPDGGSPPGVTAERVSTLEEMHQANQVFAETYELDSEARGRLRERAPERFEYEQTPGAVSRTFVARIDGEPVGVGTSVYTRTVSNLLGGSVVPHARGRGAYRALVDARWRDAVERGTPALTVQAGAMSRPILERVGFVPVGGLEILLDEL